MSVEAFGKRFLDACESPEPERVQAVLGVLLTPDGVQLVAGLPCSPEQSRCQLRAIAHYEDSARYTAPEAMAGHVYQPCLAALLTPDMKKALRS